MNLRLLNFLALSLAMSLLLFICFNALSYRPNNFEADSYIAYGKSIITDFDFNIINNRIDSYNWVVSPTLNVPDMHDHGVVLFWLPFTALAKVAEYFGYETLNSSRGAENIFYIGVFLSSVIMLTLALQIILILIRSLDKIEKLTVILFTLTTPLLYYALIENSAADTGCFLMSCGLLLAYERFDRTNHLNTFLWGALIGFARVLKISFLFHWPILIYFSLKFLKNISFKNIFYLFLGVILPLTAKQINNYYQFGNFSFFNGYDYDFYISRVDYFNNLWQNITGPFGVIHQAPWLILVVMLALFLIIHPIYKRNLKVFSGLVLFVVVSKFLYEAHAVSAAETDYGFRRYIVDLPYCLMLIYYFFKETPKQWRNSRYAILFITICLTFYNCMYFFWFRQIDKNHMFAVGIYKIFQFGSIGDSVLNFVKESVGYIFSVKLLPLLLLIIGFTNLLIFYFIKIKTFSVRFFSIYLFIGYLTLTALNSFYNEKNVFAYQSQNIYKNKVVANNFSLYLYDEVVSEFTRNLLIAKYLGNKDSFESSRSKLIDYFSDLEKGVVLDPIGFVENLKIGNYPNCVFYEFVKIHELLDFNTPSFYNQALGPISPNL